MARRELAVTRAPSFASVVPAAGARQSTSSAATLPDRPLSPVEFTRLHQIARLAVPYAYSLSGHVLYTDTEHFQPRPTRAVR